MRQSKFYQIKNITEYEYTLVGCDGSIITRPIQDVDKSASAFTIQDAKDGDVLASGGVIFIFNKIHGEWVKCHFSLYKDKSFIINSDLMTLKYGKETYPATKEEREFLFSKLKEAGYKWDAEKKELKKVEQEYHCNGVREPKEATGILKQLINEQKSDWSEDDEYNREHLLGWINTLKTYIHHDALVSIDLRRKRIDEVTKFENWFKSLKERVQPQQEWSQNDIDMIDQFILCCKEEHDRLCNDKYDHQDIVSDLKRDCHKKWDWLESLKNRVVPQNRWKPSEEQLDALETAISSLQSTALESLYNELKKL